MADHTLEMTFGAVAGALMGVAAVFGLPPGSVPGQQHVAADVEPMPVAIVHADAGTAPAPRPEAQTGSTAMEQRVEDLAARLDRVADKVESME
tara:strand:+ start:984 stop:1262 length:279 start_codon:yes stop_codon:yes gene_type:complete